MRLLLLREKAKNKSNDTQPTREEERMLRTWEGNIIVGISESGGRLESENCRWKNLCLKTRPIVDEESARVSLTC